MFSGLYRAIVQLFLRMIAYIIILLLLEMKACIIISCSSSSSRVQLFIVIVNLVHNSKSLIYSYVCSLFISLQFYYYVCSLFISLQFLIVLFML